MSTRSIKEYEDRIDCLNLSPGAYNYCQINNIQTISGLIKIYKDNGYRLPKYFADTSLNQKSRSELATTCDFFIRGLYSIKIDSLSSLIAARCELSRRAYKYCCFNKLDSVEDLLKFYVKNNKTIPRGRNVGIKTISELEDFCCKHPSLDDIYFNEEGCHITNNSAIEKTPNREVAPLEFPGLTIEDKQFCNSHFETHGHFPVLWLINKVYNQDRDVFCLFSTTPVFIGGPVGYFDDIAKKEGVTLTCVKQRYKRAVTKLFDKSNHIDNKSIYWKQLLTKDHCEYLIDSVGNADFITSFDFEKKLKIINSEEHTKFTSLFVLQLIASISDDYCVEGGYDPFYYSTDICLIHNDIYNIFDFHGFLLGFEEMIRECDIFTEINLRNYIEDSLCWKIFSYEHIDRVVSVCKSCILHKYGLYETSAENIIEIIPRRINWAKVVYNILSKEPSGLTMDEIIPKLVSQYPDHKITESTIRKAIDGDIRIQYQRGLRRKTKFLLAIHDVPNSVRDAIVRILEISEIPIHLDEIISFVKTYFPSSSDRSIRTSMINDGRSRFIQYEEGLWGLSSKSYPTSYKVVEVVSHQGFDERLVSLKRFIAEKNRYPDRDSMYVEEASLARWVDRNADKPEVVSLLEEFGPMLWKAYWSSCEEYVRGHGKKLPTRETNPILYKWYIKAMEDFTNGDLTQEQRKMMLHLAMQVR